MSNPDPSAPVVEPAPATFTHQQVLDALNEAANDILHAVNAGDEGLRDGINLMVGGSQTVAGIAFWTTEIEPLERGYDGPIKILVGMDTNGILTGVLVTQHHEPYGDFSIATPQFAAQFRGKSVRDPFRVGADIDAVSRATISITSAARAIRNSARRMATQLLVPPK